MKNYIYLGLTIIFSLLLQQDNHVGKYIFRGERSSESIELKANKEFIYYTSQEFLRYEIQGNYNIVGDSLVLDSHPQRDKIIVHEFLNKKKKHTTIDVSDKGGNPIGFWLILVLEDNITDTIKDQYKSVELKNNKFKGFYIIDTKGLMSPMYLKEGEFSNYFKVLFETKRVFENEKWYIKGDKIRPRWTDGLFKNYFLEKKEIKYDDIKSIRD